MSKFSDLPENTNPVDDDIIAIEQDSDGLNRKVKLSNLPIIDQLASTANGQGASKVGVEDSAGNFTATTVEGVLAELHAMLDGLDPWVSGTTYTAGQDAVILTTNNVIYRCTTTNSDVTFTPSNWQAVGKDTYTVGDDNATGSNVTLTAPSNDLIRLTNGSLSSIDMIPAGETGNPIWLINDTGVSVSINNETGATATNRIKTGTVSSLTLKDQSAIQVIYDTTDSRWQVIGSSSDAVSGSGTLDTWLSEDFEITVSGDFNTGNNAIFQGGGTLDGALSNETTSPISGTNSIKYVAGSSSLNDYIESPIIDLDLKQKDNESGITMYYSWDGSTDIEVVVWDETNSNKLNTLSDIINTASSSTRKTVTFTPPSSCTQIRYGFHFLVAPSNGDILIFDDAVITIDPFANVPAQRVAFVKDIKANGVSAGTATGATFAARTLNTLTGDTSFISILANQITLDAGQYLIEASAPAQNVNQHKIAMYDVTNAVYPSDLEGDSAYCPAGFFNTTRSELHGTITIVGSTVFELRHYITTTYASTGLGVATSSGLNEIYSQVKITKLA